MLNALRLMKLQGTIALEHIGIKQELMQMASTRGARQVTSDIGGFCRMVLNGISIKHYHQWYERIYRVTRRRHFENQEKKNGRSMNSKPPLYNTVTCNCTCLPAAGKETMRGVETRDVHGDVLITVGLTGAAGTQMLRQDDVKCRKWKETM
ncbi:hypothetical protein E2C01_018867 [Portunus trituberculatus]|uniref:Uncharacterized protein n=1 Tax=Portunus trituberculatus TaxID=210409 RepID=A0A5B7DWS8_PORTR|nr:hypothetical protein [Portunus trituberculatus]